mmetsp:Transcript_6137/g.7021  ORF Transcript_6137/g.7021 Transcript_6137/m.7021 type:complete len:187 (-) Transcript_6137:411-971(-)
MGGIAAQKQIRVLETRKPPIIIGTPGRLWEMMSCHEHDHLNNLSNLRFLVIDEADRMVQQGSFPQLKNILNAVHTANPLGDDDEEDSEEDDDRSETSNEEYDRLLSLSGVPGEARVFMLDDILAETKNEKSVLSVKCVGSMHKMLKLPSKCSMQTCHRNRVLSLWKPFNLEKTSNSGYDRCSSLRV